MQQGQFGPLQALLRKISEGILWIQLDGTIALASNATCKLVQISLERVLHQRFWDVFADDYFGFSMREALWYGISHQLIYKANLEISTSFFFEGPKHQHGLIVKVRDLTEKQKAQELLSHSNRMQELGEMAARLAHEIRNPLGAIRGFSTLLHRDLSNQPHLQEMVGQIIEGTRGLEKLVTSILEFARPCIASIQSHDLTAFLQRAARFIKADPSFPLNIRLQLHVPSEPLLVPFDADLLKRALLNVLLNGLQSMPMGGELSLSLLKMNSTCQITVSDTGIGMDDLQLASLFVPFFTTKETGTGLGLVEAKQILQAHGGSIEARSTLHKGSSFLMTLPLKR